MVYLYVCFYIYPPPLEVWVCASFQGHSIRVLSLPFRMLHLSLLFWGASWEARKDRKGEMEI